MTSYTNSEPHDWCLLACERSALEEKYGNHRLVFFLPCRGNLAIEEASILKGYFFLEQQQLPRIYRIRPLNNVRHIYLPLNNVRHIYLKATHERVDTVSWNVGGEVTSTPARRTTANVVFARRNTTTLSSAQIGHMYTSKCRLGFFSPFRQCGVVCRYVHTTRSGDPSGSDSSPHSFPSTSHFRGHALLFWVCFPVPAGALKAFPLRC